MNSINTNDDKKCSNSDEVSDNKRINIKNMPSVGDATTTKKEINNFFAPMLTSNDSPQEVLYKNFSQMLRLKSTQRKKTLADVTTDSQRKLKKAVSLETPLRNNLYEYNFLKTTSKKKIPKIKDDVLEARRAEKYIKVTWNEAVAMHELWRIYCINLTKIDKKYSIGVDLHGAMCSVVRATHPGFIGQTGIIVRETPRTIQLVSVNLANKGKQIVLPKNEIDIIVYMPTCTEKGVIVEKTLNKTKLKGDIFKEKEMGSENENEEDEGNSSSTTSDSVQPSNNSSSNSSKNDVTALYQNAKITPLYFHGPLLKRRTRKAKKYTFSFGKGGLI